MVPERGTRRKLVSTHVLDARLYGCHAGGRGFESRRPRQDTPFSSFRARRSTRGTLFLTVTVAPIGHRRV